MQSKRLAAIAIFLVTLLTTMMVAEAGSTKNIANANFTGVAKEVSLTDSPRKTVPQALKVSQSIQIAKDFDVSPSLNQFAPVEGCELKPPANPSLPARLTNQAIALSRFRRPLPPPTEKLSASPSNQLNQTNQKPIQESPQTNNNTAASLDNSSDLKPSANPDVQPNPQTIPNPQTQNQLKPQSKPKPTPSRAVYNPKEIIALAANSNYGDRYLQDIRGNAATIPPIIVLHETVAPASSVINYFQAFQDNEDNQASYHTMIALDGTVIYFVPPDKRAFGAGNSVFATPSTREAIQTNPKYPSSVNNFAYHISLETPADGMHNGSEHSGYTEAQYNSLAWLVAKTDVPLSRITTHRDVDRSGSRIDPRSFNFAKFQNLLSAYPRTPEIAIGCQ